MKNNLDSLIVVGDRVLIRPDEVSDKTQSGLYLPAGYQDKQDVISGYIIKCGPGYALPSSEESESWNPVSNEVRYLPLQVQPGDFAIFLQKNAIEIKYQGEKYFVAPQSAILLVQRSDF
ncbi:MAG: co-chaperone GroES [Bacteroidales bacterium]|nr:co-chaperone GroES [Bacteroidales bacterium]